MNDPAEAVTKRARELLDNLHSHARGSDTRYGGALEIVIKALAETYVAGRVEMAAEAQEMVAALPDEVMELLKSKETD